VCLCVWALQSGFIGFLDPDKYYPTVLPLEPPGMESLVDDEEIAAPPDLATAEMVESNAAEEMGLLGNQDDDQLLLFQMPDVLPIRNPKVAISLSAHLIQLPPFHLLEPPYFRIPVYFVKRYVRLWFDVGGAARGAT
jgi:hypothetical protein